MEQVDMIEDDIKPCWICKKQPIMLWMETVAGVAPTADGWGLHCFNYRCGAYSEPSKTKKEAINKWNERN